MTISPMRHLTDVTQPIVGGLVQAGACFALIDTPAEPDPGTREIGARAARSASSASTSSIPAAIVRP